MEHSSFKHFIIEAEERGNDFQRVVSAIEKRMPALLGTKIYRFGGKSGIEQLKNSKGYLYFFGAGKAFRLREKGGTIIAFDVWKKYSPEGTADFTLHTDGLSVATIANELKKFAVFFKAPKSGNIELDSVAESISFEMNSLFEAKAVSADAFLKLAQKDLSDDVCKNIAWDQIVKVARDNNVAVPNAAWLKGQKVGRGKWTLFPNEGGTSSDAKADEPKADAKKAPIMYIKVTAQDPDTKRFISAADNKEAQALYKQIQGVMDQNPTKEELRDVDSLFGHLYELTELACKGKLRSLLIYGGPGTGKTFTIMEAIKNAGLVKGKDYVKLSGKATPTEIYKTLFMFREKGLVLFDDLDSMWKDKDAANYLKAALDTSPVREISSATANNINVSKMSDEDRQHLFAQIDRQINGEEQEESTDEDDEEEAESGKKKPKVNEKLRYPSTFDFKGRVVFISNLRKEEFDSAILSRSAKIDMSLTPEETLFRMRSVLPKLGGEDVKLEVKEELIEVLLKLHKTKVIDAVTMREFTKGLDIVRSGTPNWRDLIQYA